MPELRLRVRPSECDSFGHVNNATYIGFLEYALAEKLAALGLEADWRREGEFRWALKTLTAEYPAAAVFNDELTADVWLVESDHLWPAFGCEIQRIRASTVVNPSRQVVFRARSVWARLARHGREPTPLPDGLLETFPVNGGSLPRPFQVPAVPPEARAYHWEHRVMRTELASTGYVHPEAVFRWVEDSKFQAAAEVGWPVERMWAANFVTFQSRHDTEWMGWPRAGDVIQVTSRVVEIRRLRGTWLHEVCRQPGDELLVRDLSTGLFLDRSGRPTTPPADMMNTLQFGKV